jgi:4-hydroxybenzoate polyprenyltransferase
MITTFSKKNIKAYARLMRIDRPIGTLLLLWPTLWSLWFSAQGTPPWNVIIIFVLGTFFMRAAGCVINDVADRDIDAHVQRTRNRPLAQGEISVRSALCLAAILSLISLFLAWHLPINAVYWTIPAICIAASYPWTKRFFAVPQAYLGIAYSFGIPMAFVTMQGYIPWSGWLLFISNIIWVLAYDTIYAMVDEEDDQHLGIYSSALSFKKYTVPIIFLCYVIFIVLMAWIGMVYHRSWCYMIGLISAAFLMSTHIRPLLDQQSGHPSLLIHTLVLYNTDLKDIAHSRQSNYFRIFLQHQWVGFSIFIGTVMDFLFEYVSTISHTYV